MQQLKTENLVDVCGFPNNSREDQPTAVASAVLLISVLLSYNRSFAERTSSVLRRGEEEHWIPLHSLVRCFLAQALPHLNDIAQTLQQAL